MLAEIDNAVRSTPVREHGMALQRAAAGAALLAAALPAAAVALAVWLTLGRPVLFRQVRSGLGGRCFTIVKFRTMHEHRDAAGALLPDHLRETGLTRWIRRWRLDEIPQLWAIVAGDMSFVGPRPLRPETIASFRALGIARGRVRPGLTGWAQVNGNVRLTDADKLALDIWYIDHRTLRLDLKILLMTIATLLRGERVRAEAVAAAQAHLAARFAGGSGGAGP
ncbi:sugar transferase [Rhodoligotrophos defluvii]|uniref:sugar transferase n=1 Tax=Rhodoligotrophos defluvii TaxID=2561934 RepID=UPI001EF074BF|nr:sugar transferase [Rhodoligotrophos defluvii]